MPNVTITQELGKIIRSERMSRGIHAIDVATEIGKSVAYISNIEKAKMKVIDMNTLYKIFEYIIKEKDQLKDYMNNLLNKVTIGLSEEEIKKEKWMLRFDLQYRELNIPDSLIDFINEKLISNNISSIDVIKRLNLNEGLESPEKYDFNKVYASFEDESLSSCIKFNLKESLLSDILSKKVTTINYINMLGIIYILMKFDGLDEEESKEQAGKILLENKFYTLLEKNRMLRQASKNNQMDLDSFLSSEDKEFIHLSKEISRNFSVLNDQSPVYANSKLKVFSDNLKTEPSITYAIIGVSLSGLKDLKNDKKKQFINEFKALVDKYEISKDSSINILD